MRRRTVMLCTILVWVVLLIIQTARGVSLSWRMVKSTHDMYQACQLDPVHRERFYAACVHIEHSHVSNFWMDLCKEASTHVYPFIFFSVADLLTLRGAFLFTASMIVRKSIQELGILAWTSAKNKRYQ
jgi:hypothetical protein